MHSRADAKKERGVRQASLVTPRRRQVHETQRQQRSNLTEFPSNGAGQRRPWRVSSFDELVDIGEIREHFAADHEAPSAMSDEALDVLRGAPPGPHHLHQRVKEQQDLLCLATHGALFPRSHQLVHRSTELLEPAHDLVKKLVGVVLPDADDEEVVGVGCTAAAPSSTETTMPPRLLRI